MKITQKKKDFEPITITIENEDELKQILTLANNNNLVNSFSLINDLFDYFYNEGYYHVEGAVPSHKYFQKLQEIMK